MYTKKWHPSASQRRDFALRMQDPGEKAAYEQRKIDKAIKRRLTSNFDYSSAGGNFIPTKEQHDFCFNNLDLFQTAEQIQTANMVMSAYACNEKVDHDYIHIVNELKRNIGTQVKQK